MESDLASSIPTGAFEITAMTIGSFNSPTEARLVSSSASDFLSDFLVSHVPPRVHADRPLELEVVAVGLGAGTGAGVEVSVANFISAHALLHIALDIPGQPQREVSLHVNARSSGDACIIRALARPSAWANAASVTVVSLSLAGRLARGLPATLRVGYIHALAPEGAVFEAAKAGDVSALWTAIEAGGSTEEAESVCWGEGIDPWGRIGRRKRPALPQPHGPFLLLRPLQDGWTALIWAACEGHLEALRTLLAAGANPAATSEVRGGKEGGTACALECRRL